MKILPPLPGKFAWSVTVGSKGQIVIPKEARELFDINPGDSLLLLGDVDRGIAIPPKSNVLAMLHAAVFNPEGMPVPGSMPADIPAGMPVPDAAPAALSGSDPEPSADPEKPEKED